MRIYSITTNIINVHIIDTHRFLILMTAVSAEAINRQQTMEQYLSTFLRHLTRQTELSYS